LLYDVGRDLLVIAKFLVLNFNNHCEIHVLIDSVLLY